MNFRTFGRLGFAASALGFGCMRLPRTESGDIDEEHATRMVRYAVENGINYFDTAYGYHNGESERFLGRALQGGLRQRIHLATKLPCWAVKTADDFDRLLHEQLQKLQTDHLDLYLVHGVNKGRWEQLTGLGVLAWLEKQRASGLVGALGFSFHDTFDAFQTIVDGFDGWDMCQIQYNYLCEDFQAGTRGLKYAAGKGMAVVVMEPLQGGKLANPPETVRRLLQARGGARTPVEWAFDWLWSKPEVSVALSGMSTLQQMEANVASAGRAAVGMLTEQDVEFVSKLAGAYESLMVVPCTQCQYCMPCPNGVNIPRNFSVFNSAFMYGDLAAARRAYVQFPPSQDATMLGSSCIGCLECEEQCPQTIPISEWMPYLHSVLAGGEPDDAQKRPPARRSP